MAERLAGKVAIITGGASGIGLAAVERYVEEGAKVVIADVQDELGQAAAARFAGSAAFVHTDVTSEESVSAVVDAAVEQFGRLDIMFNNAGTGGGSATLSELAPEDLEKVIAVNVRSVALGHKYAAAQFRKQGGGGSIITTVSAAGSEGGWGPSAYVISKHAALGVVRQAVNDFASYGIRSNAISPGIIMTPLFARTFGVPMEQADEFTDYLTDALKHTQPIGRVGLPLDIANAAVFLGSDESTFITGAMLPVDGGATAITQSSFGADVVKAAADFNNR